MNKPTSRRVGDRDKQAANKDQVVEEQTGQGGIYRAKGWARKWDTQ